MTWPNQKLTGGVFYAREEGLSCDARGGHYFSGHMKWADEKEKIFVRSCRRCPYVYVGQIRFEIVGTKARAVIEKISET